MRVLLLSVDEELCARAVEELAQEGIEAGGEVDEPDIIVVDGGLPDADACVKRLAQAEPDRRILFVARADSVANPPEGVAEMACMPLQPGELLGRIRLLERRRRAEANPRDVLMATAIDAAGDIIEITSPEPTYEYVNPAFVRVLGFTADEAVGNSPANVIRSEIHDPEYFRRIDETLAAGRDWKGMLISRAKDGRLVYLETTIAPVRSESGEITHHIAVKRDITARLQAEKELRRINAELEQARDAALDASRSKSQFLANMSHELRTPLNAVIGYSEMLLEEAEEEGLPTFTSDLNKIRSAGAHLLDLINDVLDLSKIEAGAMKLFFEDFEIRPTISEVVATITPLANERSNSVSVSVAPAVTTMRGDITKVRQTLLNLLSNASKFTEGGEIKLAVDTTRQAATEYVRFKVADTGIGMSPEQLQKLFRPFQQADASTTRKYGGTGLGLAISQRYCAMMGGKIEAESELGNGSTFTVLLPREVKGEEPVVPSARRADDGVDTDLPRILVIDDEPTIRDLLIRSLGKREFVVEAAASGPRGIERAREWQPDAIVLDVMMPGMDGWQVLTALKAETATAEIPVVMLTIVDQSHIGFELGAVDFIVKPVVTERLASVLRRHCKAVRAHILIVDDDAPTREIMRRALESAGHHVSEAVDGRAGIEAIAHAAPDLVLLDLMMPVMDGFAVLDHMRQDPSSRDIPVVVVTAKDLTVDERLMLSSAREVFERHAYSKRELLEAVTRRVRDCVRARKPRGADTFKPDV